MLNFTKVGEFIPFKKVYIYDFHRRKHAKRYACADVKKEKLLRRPLREPLKVVERVPTLVEPLKKKYAPKVKNRERFIL